MEPNTPEILAAVSEILMDILDAEPQSVHPEAYLMRDLEVESIDLMELAVTLNERFALEVDEELIFLRSLRPVLEKSCNTDADWVQTLTAEFPFLSLPRINEILEDLAQGPVLKVKDLVAYIRHYGSGQ